MRLLTTTICVLLLGLAPAYAAIEFTDEELAFIAEHPVIVVGGEMDWPPMDYVEDGVYKGAAKDYLDEISALTGIEFQVRTGYSWTGLLGLLRTREIDMVPMMYWTEHRGREFNLTNPYITVRHYVFTKGKQTGIGGFGDLYGKTMAIPAGYAHIEYLTEHHPDIQIMEVPSILDALDAVLIGQADAIIENTASMAYYTANQSIIGLSPAFAVKFEVDNVHMAVRNDWPVLRDVLQKALDNISTESTTEIMARWTGSEASAKTFLTTKAEFTAAEQQFLKQKGQITACVNVHRMPLETFRNQNHQGMTADYITALGDTLKAPVAAVPFGSWQEARAGLLAGRCDLMTLSLETRGQLGDLIFSSPYIIEKLALATGIEEGFYEDLSDLSGATIGIVDGYANLEDLATRHPLLDFVPYTTLEEGLEAVADGEIFGLLDYVSTINNAIRNNYERKLKISGDFADDSQGFSFALTTESIVLGDIVDKVIQSMPDSLRQNIHRKWVAVSIQKETNYKLLIQAAFVAAIVLLLVFFRYAELRKHRAVIQKKNQELRKVNSKLEKQNDSALHMAYHDQLTGLPNRAKLLTDLDHAIKVSKRTLSRLAVLFLDLDRFKPVNDTLGHDVGDELLKAVAQRIRDALRDTDMLCRIGGDEFVVVLEPVSDAYSPCIVAQRIITELERSFQIGPNAINIGTSIGIAVCPDDSDDVDTILKFADSAMYCAKENGRNGYSYYHEDLSKKATRRVEIETAIRRSLREEDFSLVFQPIVDLETRKVVKAEALARWNHPELGNVPPDEFIPIAEEFGLIVEIGDWVLRRACETMRTFIDEGTDIDAIAVNVSSVEFLKGNVAERYQSVLAEYGVRADQIEIEITERYMLDHADGAVIALQEMRDLGHTICVDDFGTGYSSLSYMKQLPLNVIKVDRSFICNIPHDQNDREISQAIISLSHSLGYQVVAEGVETKEQMNYLIDKSCNYAQGYFFSKPVPAREFTAKVSEVNEMLKIDSGWTARLKAIRI